MAKYVSKDNFEYAWSKIEPKINAKADASALPTKLSELENDTNFATTSSVETAVAGVNSALSTETSNREQADTNLQSQIDAIVNKSDVVDVVGTKAELDSYNTANLGDKDIIKVLQDSTHDNATAYYRWNKTAGSFSYIGSEGPYYTKSEAQSEFVPNTRTVNGQALSDDITLTASDVKALPDSTVIPTVNDGVLTIKRNNTELGTFSANQSAAKEINIAVPTSTSDLVNDSNFITNSAIGNGKLTINVNGSEVATFTANQSTNATADIEIAEVTVDSLTNAEIDAIIGA